MKLLALFLGILSFSIPLALYAGDVVPNVPEEPITSEKYIFYLHGSAEESEGATEKYITAIEAIAESSATVIAEIRGENDPNTYAEVIKLQVNHLIAKGVPATNITISGFSKGSIITLSASAVINNPEVHYVLLAGCSDFLNRKYSVDPTKAVGHILSIYDSNDEKFGSCRGLIKPPNKGKFEEIELNSGKGHKLFRIPKEKFIKQWRDPLTDWAGA